MNILVGVGPSFLMRRGQTEINHSCTVLAVDDQGEVMFLEKPAHRSLSEVAKLVAAHMRVCGVSAADIDEAKFAGVELLIKRAPSTVTSTLSFPELLSVDMRDFLVDQFSNFLIQFWTGRVL